MPQTTPPQPLFRLRITDDFSSSHQLHHYQGKCEELHGHNFQVRVEVQGSQLEPKTGILMDFKELKKKLASVLDTLDHCHLNELEPFARENPSSENLAKYIYTRLKSLLMDHPVQIREVGVAEKHSSEAIYSEV
ncbi:6-carboxytetrahydropterin synthase QueD [Desulfovermiculus halophilus]|jgi:6-pyruvoyltetrahydropterin/6-carboxytetrahydropterin synthase|uniref:6-carboxytetrahydropterin synthase QueD n=1 Tax=Desulfovermiculus halophilus TaxID=339722 RepID=UPI00047FBE7B|nr:6-carboxytetrahydropterin synthase QueD [Desulfovermiculus halophilus]